MGCFPESTYAIYADGELAGDETRLVEAHLVGCRSCRVLVSALRDEASLLADTLLERARPWQTAPTATGPDPSVAWSLPAAVGAVTAILAVASFLIEWRWPSGVDQLHPLRLKGAFEMAFDVVFMLRERAPGLTELALALGAVAAVSALLSFGLGIVYQRLGRGALALPLAFVFALSAEPARAVDLRWDVEEARVAAGETLADTLAVSADEVAIDGTLDGDLIVVAKRLTIRGSVRGAVYAFARSVEVSGTILGALHVASERVRIEGSVGEGLYAAGDDIAVTPSGRVGRDAFVWGERAEFEGSTGRDLCFVGEALEIRGRVDRNVQVLYADQLALRDGAQVAGNVNATLAADEIEIDAGAVVGGTVTRRAPDRPVDHYFAHYLDPSFYVFLLVRLAAAFVFGMLLYLLVPRVFDAEVPDASGFFRSLGTGFLFVIVGPVAIVCAALTVVGIPIAVLAAFAYATLLYSSKIAVGALVGRALIPPEDRIGSFGLTLLVGLVLVYVASSVPILGPPVAIVTLLFGLGLIYLRVRARWGAVSG